MRNEKSTRPFGRLRLVGYVRVSDVHGREGERFISPTLQRQRIEAYATAHDYEITAWQEDLDRSGADKHRPGILAAVEQVENGEADGIAVAKLDRFARSQRVAIELLDRLEQARGVLVSVEDNFDTATPIGRAMRAIMLVFAELEREQRRDGLLRANENAVARGLHITAFPPAGYVRDDDGRLVQDATTAPLIREVFLRRATGTAWEDLAAYLDEHDVRTSRGGRPTGTFVSRLVANLVYTGQARGPGGVSNDHAHKPIVSRAEFDAAQLKRRARPSDARPSLLSELVRCAGCARAMTPANGQYACRRRYPAGNCPSPSVVTAKRIEEFVVDSFFGELGDGGPTVDVAEANDELAEANRAVDEADLELVSYRDANLVSVIGQEAYVAGLQKRAQRLQDAQGRLQALENTANLGQTLLGRAELADGWDGLTVAEQRSILGEAIDVVLVRATRGTGRRAPIEERARIFWRGTGPAELPSRGRVSPLLDLRGLFD